MNAFIVRYDYVDDAEALAEHRPAHREFLRNHYQAGTVLASGPQKTTPPSAVIVLTAEDAYQVREILDEDPFMKAGLITERRINEWEMVLGSFNKPA